VLYGNPTVHNLIRPGEPLLRAVIELGGAWASRESISCACPRAPAVREVGGDPVARKVWQPIVLPRLRKPGSAGTTGSRAGAATQDDGRTDLGQLANDVSSNVGAGAPVGA
jgi:hypothetical protein